MGLAAIKQKTELKPPRIILYGGAGVGKSSFGASMNAPIFLLTEDGLGKIQVDHFPLAEDYEAVKNNLQSLIDEDHKYKTLVVDSLDWLEPLLWNKICEDNNWKSIEQPGYGRGYVEVLKYWREYLDMLNVLRNKKNMTILQVCHNVVKRVVNPEIDEIDQNQLKLHAKSAALISEFSDAVFFTNYKLGTVKVQGKNGQTKTKAVSGDRVIYTEERPAFLAKNRYGLDSEMPFDWEAIRKAMLSK